MKLNLDKPFLALDGKEIAGTTMAKLLADRLAGETSGQSKIKLLDWAMTMFREGGIEIDDADLKWLEGFIAGNQSIPALFGGQLLKEIESQKGKS